MEKNSVNLIIQIEPKNFFYQIYYHVTFLNSKRQFSVLIDQEIFGQILEKNFYVFMWLFSILVDNSVIWSSKKFLEKIITANYVFK